MLNDTNVTIIVPTQNAKPYADRQIAGLQNQTLRPVKIVAIDSGSTDGSGDIYRAAGCQVMSIAAHDFDHGATRNLGFRQTHTEIVLYLTHDAIPHNEHAIARLCAPFADPKVGIVYGRQLARRQASAIERHARLFNYATTSHWRQWPRDRALGFRSLFCSNAFAAYRRQTLEEIGGFPEQVIFGEDQVAAGRALLAGWTVVYAGDAEVEHSHGYSPTAEFHRYFDIGVCARINRALFERFGTANGDGRHFVVSEIRYLLRHAPLRIPEAGMRTSLKVLGYLLGRHEMMLPVFIKCRLAMNAKFYRARQTYKRFDRTMRAVVLCDNNGLGQVVLDSLHANGVKAWLIYTRAAQSLRYSRSTTPVMAVDGTLAMHANAITGLINDMHNKQPIDIVLSSDVKGALVLCDIQRMLIPPIFPAPDRPTLEMLDDKWRFYLYCQKLGLPVPKTLYFDTPAIDVAKVNREIGFPVVMKPIRESGAAGVVVVQDAAELTRCIACYRYSPVVIQEYIAGTDIGLSLFARDGRILCATTFYCGAKTRTEFADIPAMTALCQRIAKSTNYSGVANFDARIDPSGQINLFECNPRFFVRLNAVRLAGIDFLRMGLSGMAMSNRFETVKTVYSRGDPEGIRRMLTDRVTARVMLRSWYEFLSNPGPRLMTRFNGGWKATLR